MAMSNDYLWDGSGPPDPEVERLERMLGPLRSTAPVPDLAATVRLKSDATSIHTRWNSARFLLPMLAAAASILAMIGVTWPTRGPRSWEVERMAGQPRIGSMPLAATGRLAVGQTLFTDASSRARLDVSTIGQATVDTDSRVRLVDTRDGHHQLALERGTLHAFIVAPPGQFVVDTPSATATDLGCVYTLHVDEDGTGTLSVTAGWVAFEFNGRESFVPAGASSRTDPRVGPGTPRYDDADDDVRRALDDFDYGTDLAAKARDLQLVLARASTRDAMTLWHLIARVSPADRGAVIDALNARVPMPSGVTREAVMRLDKPALDQWWDTLGLRDASWWRMWKGKYPLDVK
jgi:hypothetical protein